MKKFLPFILLLFGIYWQASAQQLPRYSQYMFNGLVINPAYAGSVDGLSGSLFYRNQWAGFDGAPKTFALSLHSPVIYPEKMGLGFYVEHDQIGKQANTAAYISYAYKIPVKEGASLALGLQAGINNYNADWSSITSLDENDPVFMMNDARTVPNFGLGLYFSNEVLYAGLSIPQLINNKLNNIQKLSKQYRHYLFSAGGIIKISEPLKLRPSILLKYVPSNAPLQADLNMSFLIMDALWIGASYRNNTNVAPESVVFILSYLFNNGLRIGYAYDLTTTEISNHTSGSHEITVGFDFRSKKKESIVTPRYF